MFRGRGDPVQPGTVLGVPTVPALWPFEVANALASAQRRDRITAKGIDLFLEQLRQLPIHVERREALWLCKAAIALAREHSLSAYDAAYLELAKREGLPLATLDETLRRAAQLAGVAILAFS